MEIKNQHGGRRIGAGRPTNDRNIMVGVRLSQKVVDKLNLLTSNKSEYIENLIKEQSAWISAEKELPVNGELVICSFHSFYHGSDHLTQETHIAFFDGERFRSTDGICSIPDTLKLKDIYWMPIPKLPNVNLI